MGPGAGLAVKGRGCLLLVIRATSWGIKLALEEEMWISWELLAPVAVTLLRAEALLLPRFKSWAD